MNPKVEGSTYVTSSALDYPSCYYKTPSPSTLSSFLPPLPHTPNPHLNLISTIHSHSPTTKNVIPNHSHPLHPPHPLERLTPQREVLPQNAHSRALRGGAINGTGQRSLVPIPRMRPFLHPRRRMPCQRAAGHPQMQERFLRKTNLSVCPGTRP